MNHCAIFHNKNYRITINPTLECNFKCWYCYEKHPQGYLSQENQEKIIKHIDYVLKNKLVTSIDLGWFGGEPLLYFDSIVYPMSSRIKELVNSYQASFSNHVTTNAYLITEEMIEKFETIDLNSFQITTDGDERKHNSIRNENSCPSFKRIIQNVIRICEKLPNSSVALRINYDNITLKNIESIFLLIPNKLRNKIIISLNRVWQTITSDNKKNFNESNIFNNIITKCLEYGYNVASADSLPKSFIRCHSDKFWNLEVNYDGKIFKCTMDYSQESQGKFGESGEIIWKDYINAEMYGQVPLDNSRCLKCKLLPICLGPCSRKSLEYRQNPSSTLLECNMNNAEVNYKDLIIQYYETNMLEAKRIEKINS